MKTSLSTLLALGLVAAELIFGSGCGAQSPEGLDDSAAFEYEPDAEAAPYFEAVIERIYQASGVVLSVVPGGTAIRFVPTLPSENEMGYDCGQTPVTYWSNPTRIKKISIDILYPTAPGCDSLRGALTHEVIHSLRQSLIEQDSRDPDHGHSSSGVFFRTGGDKLDEASLNAICEAVDCTTYNPEH